MKTYCISDIHGHLDNLIRFVNTIEKDDRVFVLGDVIDKGNDSIKCLKLVKNDSRFVMLLGNHEYMMFQYLTSKDDKSAFTWMILNEGYPTYTQYESLSDTEQKEILDYISNLPLNIPNLEVNERTYYLVHSCPHSNKQITMKDVDYNNETIGAYIWDRVSPYDGLEIDKQIVIAGHTFVHEYLGLCCKEIKPVFKGDDILKVNYIDIDGGLATGLPNSSLIALCLDDLSYKLY